MIDNTISKAIRNVWPMLIIFLIVIIVVRISYLIINHKKIIIYKEINTLFFIVYALLLYELLTSGEKSSGVNLIPFTEIMRYKFGSTLFYYNVIGNILLFLPFGYFVSDYVNAKKIRHIFIIGLVTSLTIESVQFLIGRTFDVDDILLNVVGAILGFFLYVGLKAIKTKLPGIFKHDIIYNIIAVILLILVVLYLVNLLGFRWI